MNPLAIVTKFLLLLDGQKDYNAAAMLLDDHHFEFVSPKKSFKTKADWIEGFPAFHKDPPIFDLPRLSEEHSHQVLRNGKKKFGPIKVSLVESYEVNQEGKIERLSVSRA